MLDVTWDDQRKDGLHYYTYFDLTTNEMNGYGHIVDSTNIRVPECTSVKHAFYKELALCVESAASAPMNYKAVIDYVVKNKEKYLEIYMGNQPQEIMQKYISEQIFSAQSEVQKYIKNKGYKITFDAIYYISGKYCYIRIK